MTKDLGFRLPRQAPAGAEDQHLVDTRQIQVWFDGLPIANVGATGKEVYSALTRMNSLEVPALLRARLLEHFRDPVDYLVKNLERHYVGTWFPLSDTGEKTALLAQRLYFQMALAYEVIADDLLSARDPKFDRNLLVIALHRVIHYLRYTLQHAQLVYMAAPEGLWRDCHAVYAYARQNRIHQLAVKERTSLFSKRIDSIEQVYTALLILATCSCNRLQQPQIKQVFARAPQWARSVTLSLAGTSTLAQRPLFSVDLRTDAPPLPDAAAAAAHNDLLLLDFAELVEELGVELRQTEAEAHDDQVRDVAWHAQRMMLKKILAGWRQPASRRFVRAAQQQSLDVVVGLPQIHAYLMRDAQTHPVQIDALQATSAGGHTDAAWEATIAADREVGSLPSAPRAAAGTPARGVEIDITTRSEDPPATPAPPNPALSDHVRVLTLNQSVGGYRVRWGRHQGPRLGICELLGIASQHPDHPLGLGVVRWLQKPANGPLEFGMQLIAARCDAGTLTALPQQDTPAPADAICLVIRNSAQDMRVGVIVQASLLGVGAQRLATLRQQRWHLRVERLLESCGVITLFQARLSPLETPQTAAVDGEFDDLWRQL